MVKLISSVLLSLISLHVQAEALKPVSADLINTLSQKVLRIKTTQNDGQFIFGSGVVVGNNQVITNCHVITNAASIAVITEKTELVDQANVEVVSVKPDWKHDLCLLQTQALNIAPVNLKPTQTLHYEQTVFNIGHPSFVANPVSKQGTVKGIFPMDDSVIIRASSEFNVGASGGGLFDTEGNLVGIITLKSPGKQAYHYYMATEWVSALFAQPSVAITSKNELPFWGTQAQQWPHFMKVVQPYLTKDWNTLKTIAQTWVTQEPNNHEAWYHLALAEEANREWQAAETHLAHVIALNKEHTQALEHLATVSKKTGKQIALLN